ncbi:MAG: PAS domain S-box protein [Syntrophobacteraceae bacterium]|nr:PAS domain S-box protein [Syntrophobacteraceae bacterium]
MKTMRFKLQGMSFPGRRWLMGCLIISSFTIVAGWGVADYLGAKARREIIKESHATTMLLAARLTYEVKKMEGVVKSLSLSPWIAPALTAPTKENIERANSTLDRYNEALSASVTYLLDKTGRAVASSNRREADSFVGKGYQFRPYFTEALRGHGGHYFALGVTSLQRGLFASCPVTGPANTPVGVMVMKTDLDQLQTQFRHQSYCFFVSPQGIIFLSGKAGMLLKSLWPLQPGERNKLIGSRQFGNGPFEVLLPREVTDGMEVRLEGKWYLASRREVDREGWSIVILAPQGRIAIYESIGVILTVVVLLLLIIPISLAYHTMKSAEVLRRSEERFQQVGENSQEWIWEVDRRGRYVYSSQAVRSILGYELAEVIGKLHWEFFDPEEKERIVQEMRGYFDRKETFFRIACKHLHRNGHQVFLECTGAPLFDAQGEVAGYWGANRDITERKRAEEEAEKIREKYKTFFETSRDCVFITSTDGRWIDFNEAAVVLFGYQDGEELRTTRIANFYENGQDRQNHVAIIKEKGFSQDYRVNLRKKDGSIINALITAVPKKDQDGAIIGYQGVIKDLTNETMLQERLFRAEKMEALGMLAGGVAHDLNNVLGILIGYSELLFDKIEASNPARSHALHIKQAGERAAAIVQDLLTLARRGVPVVEVYNLNRVVEDYQKTLVFERLLSSHPGVKVETCLDPELFNIEGSHVHLGQTLMNLVSNVAEAMPRGGVLTVKTENRYLDRPVTGYDEVREGDYVVLSVSDTGDGIAPTDLKHIFEPFYTRKVMGKSGTGLGLSVVWGTVKDHRGYINVETEEGKGTIFSLYFPITRKQVAENQVSSSVLEYMGNGQTILVVDDVEAQRELADRMLTKLNYRVRSASGGEAAVEYLKTQAVDLIVLDMIMAPGMDGLDTYIKILQIHPGQKAIIVSGFAETGRVQKAQELGAGGYLKKPYSLEKLGMAVKKEILSTKHTKEH